MSKKKSETQSFESRVQRLNDIADALDGGETSLEESIALYEEGIALIERCVQDLAGARTRILELRRKAEGAFALIDFSEQS